MFVFSRTCVPAKFAVLIPSSPVVALVGRTLPHPRAETSFRCLGGLQTEKLVPVSNSYAWMAVNIGMPLITNAMSDVGWDTILAARYPIMCLHRSDVRVGVTSATENQCSPGLE